MPTDPAEPVHLSPLEIWYMYKTKILTYVGIIVTALILFASYQLYTYLRTTGSQSLYEKAQTAAEFQAVVQKYPGTVAAGNATLRLADKLREEKKYDEAVKVLRNFVEKNPGHPLAAGGWTSIGATYELEGKLDEAFEAYASAIAKYPDAYTTPISKMAQARIYLQKGKKEDARRTYQDVVVRFPQSIFAQQAKSELHFITK